MGQYTVMLSSSASPTRLLLLDGKEERLRAVLPPGHLLRQRRAASGLLVEEFGQPARSVYYEVQNVERRRRLVSELQVARAPPPSRRTLSSRGTATSTTSPSGSHRQTRRRRYRAIDPPRVRLS